MPYINNPEVSPQEELEHQIATTQEAAGELTDTLEEIRLLLAEQKPTDAAKARADRQIQELRYHLTQLDNARITALPEHTPPL